MENTLLLRTIIIEVKTRSNQIIIADFCRNAKIIVSTFWAQKKNVCTNARPSITSEVHGQLCPNTLKTLRAATDRRTVVPYVFHPQYRVELTWI